MSLRMVCDKDARRDTQLAGGYLRFTSIIHVPCQGEEGEGWIAVTSTDTLLHVTAVTSGTAVFSITTAHSLKYKQYTVTQVIPMELPAELVTQLNKITTGFRHNKLCMCSQIHKIALLFSHRVFFTSESFYI